MKKSMILGLLAITLFSCKKEEVLKPLSGVYREQSVFPMWEGDIWRCDQITYNYMDSSKSYQTYYDTLKAPQKRYDGKEYYSFFYEFYTLLDFNTLQTSFENTSAWPYEEYPGEYVWFADVNKIDTLSTIQFYSDVSPNKARTIAYPERVKMNGYDCKRTEIVYFSSYNGADHYEGKRVVYFSKGYGPVYEVQYWSRLKDFNIPNGPTVEYKAYEKSYTRVK